MDTAGVVGDTRRYSKVSGAIEADDVAAAAKLHDVRAAEAVALFCYQIKKWIGRSRLHSVGWTPVFAGGIGESAPVIRTVRRARDLHNVRFGNKAN